MIARISFLLFFSVLVYFTGSTSLDAQSQQREEPAQKVSLCNETRELSLCAGKTVRVRGPLSYSEHSVYVAGLKKKKLANWFQNSLATAFGDVGIVTADKIDCNGEIEAVGMLDIAKHNCSEGTKCIPKEYFIIVDYWSCLRKR